MLTKRPRFLACAFITLLHLFIHSPSLISYLGDIEREWLA
ncbi:MAG: hypothetical protein ANABAC_2290 [Anaerolineae bacterium]|nr:MAG: hypothetical protein ANABAC_2290 [Anaerolineae bacterium]